MEGTEATKGTEGSNVPLAAMGGHSLAELGRKTVPELQTLAQAAGLGTGGRKGDLLARLRAAKSGGAAGYVPGKTLCTVCKAPTDVKGTKTEEMEDGRILVTRYLRCRGKHRHSYPQREIQDQKKI